MFDLKKLKIIYMGTPSFSATLLNRLIEEGFNITLVVTKEDAPVGRKKILTPSPVKEVALLHNISLFTPHRIRLDYEAIINAKADIIITFAYGQIVPLTVLEATRFGALNLHGSLLPAYRGASPIQCALMDGLQETGVTLMRMVEKMDAGVMFAKKTFALTKDDNFKTVSEKMVEPSLLLLKEELPRIVNGENLGEVQDESQVTFAPLLKAKDEILNLEMTAKALIGKISAFAPDVGAYLYYDDLPLKIFKAYYFSNEISAPVGTLSFRQNHLILQAKDGEIEVLMLQKAGKKVVDARSFYNGEKARLPLLLRGFVADA